MKNWNKLRDTRQASDHLRKKWGSSFRVTAERVAAKVATLEVRAVVDGAVTTLTRVGPGEGPATPRDAAASTRSSCATGQER